MSSKTFNSRIQDRKDTSANWTTNNPVLLDGEQIIVVTELGEIRHKTGDGVKTYTQLPFDDEILRNKFNDYVPLSGSTMNGELVAQNNTNYTVKQVRNIILSTVAPADTDGQNGDIWIKYTP